MDPEKSRRFYDSLNDESPSESSVASSRRSSDSSHSSRRPMLIQTSLVSSFNSRHQHSLRYRLPIKVTRCLSFSFIFVLLIFILSLVRASIHSTQKIQAGNLGIRPPSPPKTWESFPFLTRYYGGIRSLSLASENKPQYPPSALHQNDSSSTDFSIPIRKFPTSMSFEAFITQKPISNKSQTIPAQKCYIDDELKFVIPQLQHYIGRPYGFPEHIIGSYELLELPEDVCFERFGRLGPYGYGYAPKYGGTGTGVDGDREGSEAVWQYDSESIQIDYRKVDWAASQKKCFDANKARFKDEQHLRVNNIETSSVVTSELNDKIATKYNSTAAHVKPLSRTAIVVRVWDDYEYHEEDILNLRAMISELSLGSGGEYDVHLLVQVKNEGANPIWADAETYQKHLNESVPQEFRGLATFWSVTQMLMLYQGIFDTFTRGPDLPIHGPYRGLQMAMQYFAHKHPEYDFFWHWEIDTRYTGHYYNLFSRVNAWSTNQPRKGLWERSSRYYIPSVHGSWEDFKHMVRIQTEMSVPDRTWPKLAEENTVYKSEKPIWGPERPQHEEDLFETEDDPIPPTKYEEDKYQWGVGEPADLITLNPLFNPDETTWLLAEDITGYNISDGLPDRRAAVITSARLSKRLLRMMHRETAFKKHHAFPEMWPATVALHHGYKAVYVPHPMFVDREWPTNYLRDTVNAGRSGATGGARTSVFGAREHNLLGMTWYYNAGFAPNLWKRWLGLKVNNDGGVEFELTIDESKNLKGVDGMRGGEGRMCLPPMLLHPVKSVILPVEGNINLKENIPESNPAA